MDEAAQVPWDRIITAAAASTLGVVCLVLLVVGAVAVLLFRNSGDRARMVALAAVVVIALIGLAVAVLRERSEALRSAAAPAPEAAPETATASAPAGGRPSPVVADAGPAAEDLSGTWHDDDGYTYQVTVTGNRFAYLQLFENERVGSGEGTIEGRRLDYRYVSDRTRDEGACTGLVATDRSYIDGSCSNGGDPWGFKIERGAS